MCAELQLVVDAHAQLGEGPIWDDESKRLYWVDILSNHLHAYDPATKVNRTWDVGQHVGTVVPRAQGGVMLALYGGFAAFDLETEEMTFFTDPEADLPGNRFNDGKCDPAGRFWAGSMAYENPSDQGNLWRLDLDGSVHKIMDNIAISNGLVWSSDSKTFYYIDTRAYNVRAYDYDDASGNISNERVVIEVKQGMGGPDGMAIDAEDKLWVAHFGGGCIRRWDPESGRVMETVDVPAAQTTACAFGGPDLDTLYITCAAMGLSDAQRAEQPHAGGLFAIKTSVRGRPTFRFAG